MKEFNQLVKVKEMREEKAGRTVQAQRRVLESAVTERDGAQVRLSDFRSYAHERERRIYQALCERVVQLRDIEDVHGQVQVLRSREADHREELDAAEARRAQAQQQLEDDKAAHRAALRVRDKFVDLGEIFASRAREDAERAEEGEIEEAAGTRRPCMPLQEPT